MGTGAIAGSVDVAQLVLYGFWLFFAALIYYLVRENHREGYPMETTGRGKITGWPIPRPKTFRMPHGEPPVTVPNDKVSALSPNAQPSHNWIGAPLEPVGDPLLAGIGPGSWAERADIPDAMLDGSPKIVPLSKLPDFEIARQDRDPRGMTVLGCDGKAAGVVTDVWLDQMEVAIRYLTVQLASDAARTVLVPINFTRIGRDAVKVGALYAQQFSGVPGLKSAERITLLEEERVMAYFGAGTLYADASRAEPLL
jgi:photosynthetic reaction center H subunit